MELNMFKVTQETVDKLHQRESRIIQANLRARQLNLEKAFDSTCCPWELLYVGDLACCH